MSTAEFVKVEKAGGIAEVVIDRPKALNALNRQVLAELGAVFHGLQTDEVSAVARAPAETQDYMQKVLRNAAFYGHASRADATTVSQASPDPGTKRRRGGV